MHYKIIRSYESRGEKMEQDKDLNTAIQRLRNSLEDSETTHNTSRNIQQQVRQRGDGKFNSNLICGGSAITVALAQVTMYTYI